MVEASLKYPALFPKITLNDLASGKMRGPYYKMKAAPIAFLFQYNRLSKVVSQGMLSSRRVAQLSAVTPGLPRGGPRNFLLLLQGNK